MISAQFEGRTPAGGTASIGMGKEDEETSTDADPWSYDSLRHRSPGRHRSAPRESPTRRAGAAILSQLPTTSSSTPEDQQNGIFSPPTAPLASHAFISRTGGDGTNLASVSPFEAAHSLLLLTSSAPVLPERQGGSVWEGSKELPMAVTNDDDDGIAGANEDDGTIVGADMDAGTPIRVEAKKSPSIAVARQVTPSFGSPSDDGEWSLSGRDSEYRKKMIVNM